MGREPPIVMTRLLCFYHCLGFCTAHKFIRRGKYKLPLAEEQKSCWRFVFDSAYHFRWFLIGVRQKSQVIRQWALTLYGGVLAWKEELMRDWISWELIGHILWEQLTVVPPGGPIAPAVTFKQKLWICPVWIRSVYLLKTFQYYRKIICNKL